MDMIGMRDDRIDLSDWELEHGFDDCQFRRIDWILFHFCTCIRGSYPNAGTKVLLMFWSAKAGLPYRTRKVYLLRMHVMQFRKSKMPILCSLEFRNLQNKTVWIDENCKIRQFWASFLIKFRKSMHTQFARSNGRFVSKSANLHQKCRFFLCISKILCTFAAILWIPSHPWRKTGS